MGSSGSTQTPRPGGQTSSIRVVSPRKTDKQATSSDHTRLTVIDTSKHTPIQTGDRQKQNGRRNSNLHSGNDCQLAPGRDVLTRHIPLPPKAPSRHLGRGNDGRRPSIAYGDRRPPTRSHRPRTAPSRPKTSVSISQRPTLRGRQISTKQLQKVDQFSRVLHGDMSVACPFSAKIVRIFTSSTFTDTEHERNALMERVYPRLKERCRQLGYEFQVVDMRWGVRDEATDDHMTSELCLLEIDLCMKLSTGPCFVTFLSHKYGYRPLPSQISSPEFVKVMSAVKRTEDKDLLYRWYQEDENADPPTYVLQPISSLLPDFLCESGEHQDAKDTWYEVSDQMKMALEEAARETLEPRDAHRYVMSVTEKEIAHALFTSDNVAGRSAWFDRRLRDIDKSTDSPTSALCRYKDVRGSDKQIEDARQLLQALRDNKLPVCIPDKCHVTYSIQWSDKGVDPATIKEHKAYIDQLCEDFEKTLSGMITHGIQTRASSDTDTELFQEVVQHVSFCQQKCSTFHGREVILKTIHKYVTGDSDSPLTVFGVSGSGKTSVVAMAAKQTSETQNDGVLVVRFIGTTPESSSVCSLLKSVTSQVWTIYGHEVHGLPSELKELSGVFYQALQLAHESKPLVVLLDSLDQLDNSDNGRQLTWLPTHLPPHVKLIVSTLPETQHECLQRLQTMVSSRGHFVQVPKLPDVEATCILDKWLETAGRKLTKGQRRVINAAFQQCPLPLFLKLAFDVAQRWRSFTPVDETLLETTVRGCIKTLFLKLERAHGRMFVSRALGYMTISRRGLTETELEDILSCDDDVLNDVYMYWTPPLRRLPPLLLVRLKTEFSQYLVDKGADGVRVFFWYHRQFIEAAYERYCSDEGDQQKMHAALGDFFSGVWAYGAQKPYTDKQGIDRKADRHVTAQQLRFGDSYNLRLLNNLPFHRLRAGQMALLKQECLCNFSFLQAKLVASGLRQVLDDFQEARNMFSEDSAISTIGDALQLSQGALIKYPYELPSQLRGRIKEDQELRPFLQQCDDSQAGYLVANQPILTRPGGQLVHCLAGHKEDITGLAITCDGEYALTCSRDKTLKVWDINGGKLCRSIDNVGEDPDTIRLCLNDRLALVNPDGAIQAYEVSTGNRKYAIEVDLKAQFCCAGPGETTVAVFTLSTVQLYRANNGHLMQEVQCPYVGGDISIGDAGPSAGSGDYLVTTDTEQRHLFVFNVQTSTFNFMKDVFSDDGEAREEMETVDALALIDDGRTIVVSNMFSNDLHLLDSVTLQEMRVLKGSQRDILEKFHVTPDCRYVYFANFNNIVAWDVPSEERHAILGHHTSYHDVATADMELVVTTGEDHVVKVWDISREATTDAQHDGFTISRFAVLDNPRYVVLVGSYDVSRRFLNVYDLVTCTNVRQFQVVSSQETLSENVIVFCVQNADIKDLVVIDNHRVMVRVGRKLKIVDFSKMAVSLTFQGQLPLGSYRDFCVVKQRKEVVSVTRGRRHIKVYKTATGKVSHVIKSEEEQRLICVLANKSGTTLIAETEEGTYLVFDLTKQRFRYKFDPVTLNFRETYTDGACVTEDGRFFIFNGEKMSGDDSAHSRIYAWNINKREMEHELTDEGTYEMFLDTGDIYYDTSVDSFVFLPPSSVLANLNDGRMRLYDIISGSMTMTLPGHASARMCIPEAGPYVLTRGTWVEDRTFRLLDRKTFQSVATFTPDFNLAELSLTSDGHHCVGYFPNYPEPVVWTLRDSNAQKRQKGYKPLSAFTCIYGDKAPVVVAYLETAQDSRVDPGDPDTDVDESEDDVIDEDDADFDDDWY